MKGRYDKKAMYSAVALSAGTRLRQGVVWGETCARVIRGMWGRELKKVRLALKLLDNRHSLSFITVSRNVF